MSTVRINDDIKKDVMPILDDLGLSLSDAINIFLHQIKIKNGIPFKLNRSVSIELNDGNGSYICEYGHLHDYRNLRLKELEEEFKNNKSYNSAKEMFDDFEKEFNEEEE